MQSSCLFVDDERQPVDVTWVDLPLEDWKIVRSYNEFVAFITMNGLPRVISFDHDLADEHYKLYHEACDSGVFAYEKTTEKTGYHCAYWLVQYCLENKFNLPKYYIHTMNPVGAKNIRDLLGNFDRYSRFNKKEKFNGP